MLSPEDREAIRELRGRLRVSIVSGDAAAYAACFAEDAVLMHPDSPQVRGRTSIAEYVAAMFDAVSVPELDLSEVILDGDENFAFEVGSQHCVVDPVMPGFKRERQHLHAYCRAADGAWYIAAAMSGNQ
jgi:uncharacterized protein (TIGR02246 family)